MADFEPFADGEGTRDGDVVTTVLTTKPGYRILGAEVVGETLLALTFAVDTP